MGDERMKDEKMEVILILRKKNGVLGSLHHEYDNSTPAWSDFQTLIAVFKRLKELNEVLSKYEERREATAIGKV